MQSVLVKERKLSELFPEVINNENERELFDNARIQNINVYKKSRKLEIFIVSDTLIDAIDRFNPSYGNLFETFAIPTIVGNLKRYLRDYGWAISVPRSMVDMAYSIQKKLPEIAEKLGHEPTIKEIADELELDEEQVSEVLAIMAVKNTSSIDSKITDESDTTGEELLGLLSDRDLEDEALLEIAVAELPEPERFIIEKRLEGLSQSEIAKLLNISQAQVSRFERKAITKLREAIHG